MDVLSPWWTVVAPLPEEPVPLLCASGSPGFSLRVYLGVAVGAHAREELGALAPKSPLHNVGPSWVGVGLWPFLVQRTCSHRMGGGAGPGFGSA